MEVFKRISREAALGHHRHRDGAPQYALPAFRRSAESCCDKPWVNLPEYILHRLGGRAVSEYTNATHTQLVDAEKRAWSPEIFATTGLVPDGRASARSAPAPWSAG